MNHDKWSTKLMEIVAKNDFANAYRFHLSSKQMNVGDWTSNRWVTCFANEAEQILGEDNEIN